MAGRPVRPDRFYRLKSADVHGAGLAEIGNAGRCRAYKARRMPDRGIFFNMLLLLQKKKNRGGLLLISTSLYEWYFIQFAE